MIPIDAPKFKKIGMITLKTKIVDALHERLRCVIDPDAPDVLNQEVTEEILDENLGYLAGELVG